MKKRVLSILLCVIMLCGLLPTAALANNTATVTFQVRTVHEASGTVSYRFGSEGAFEEVTPDNDGTASIDVPSEATSITVKAEPAEGFFVNQSQSGIWDGESNSLVSEDAKPAFFDALTGEGYPYTLTADTPQFVIEFDNNDGTGGNGSENGNQQQSDNIEV